MRPFAQRFGKVRAISAAAPPEAGRSHLSRGTALAANTGGRRLSYRASNDAPSCQLSTAPDGFRN
ncbi:hypothetical protein [Leptolyngbya sp. BC1307]|uniref:hypothetical protein n=1 Tax=Leptolyngbya sp. BC1307 TaxID=2029589 RepID=UPI001140D51A|nr:hypothetical protein [Leptolyngbya sp. BC1307]